MVIFTEIVIANNLIGYSIHLSFRAFYLAITFHVAGAFYSYLQSVQKDSLSLSTERVSSDTLDS